MNHRLENWASPKSVIGLQADHPADIAQTSAHNSKKKSSSANEFAAMLEYVQFNAATRLSEVETSKSRREIELLNRVKQSEFTVQRLTTEQSKLRETYSKFLTQNDDSRRTLLRLQGTLNHAGVAEYECQNKLEMERLTHAAAEKEFRQQLQTLEAIKKLAEERAVLKHREAESAKEELRVLSEERLRKERRLTARIMYRAMEAVSLRLQYKAFARWRACSSAATVSLMTSKRSAEAQKLFITQMETLKSELQTLHFNELAFLNQQHCRAIETLETKHSRVLKSRDAIYTLFCLSERTSLLRCFSFWKSQSLVSMLRRTRSLESCATEYRGEINALAKEVKLLRAEKIIVHQGRRAEALRRVQKRSEGRLMTQVLTTWRSMLWSQSLTDLRYKNAFLTEVSNSTSKQRDEALTRLNSQENSLRSFERQCQWQEKRIAVSPNRV